ncbi:hypothetical protein [Streptomyces sp. NPDC013187]|uniref:hypothetical protein n=1 Tax=Streptomyces sp. NPDC013187 TaxID=3364865 RepID=UPI0036C062B4
MATAYAVGPSLSAALADTGPLPAHTVRAGGWLPGVLVEQVSRSAVQLLNLEVTGRGRGWARG